MSTISNSYFFSASSTSVTQNKQNNPTAETSSFEALLSGFDSSLNANSLAGDFLTNITNALNSNFLGMTGPEADFAFPFTDAFVGTFGTTGPLPNFIDAMTRKLNLTEAQNKAFQDIAVKNQDITYTPANVQKIAMQLQQAGVIV